MKVPFSVRSLRAMAGTLLTIALVAAVALFLTVALLPRLFGAEMRSVDSSSMEPSVHKGALVIAFPASIADVHQGDVVMFRAPDGSGKAITHRVEAVDGVGSGAQFETKGDANDAPDAWRISNQDLMGKVEFNVAHVGGAVDAIRSPAGFVLLMLVPVLLIVFAEAPLRYRSFRSRSGRRAAPHGAMDDAQAQSKRRAVRTRDVVLVRTAIITVAVFAVAGFTYARAPRYNDAGAQSRLRAEAVSLTAQSARLANRDAYEGDLQLLRDADDPALRAQALAIDADAAKSEDVQAPRVPPLTYLIASPTNMFDALALVALDGRIVATTDATIVDVHASAAFAMASAHGDIATSDIAMNDARHGTIDYAAPVRDADGKPIAVLLGRSNPSRVWAASLATTVDASRNVLIGHDGTVLAGVSGSYLGAKWAPDPLADGAVRANVAGISSMCGVGAIGAGTHFDQGWQIASCVPLTMLAASPSSSYRRFAMQTLAAAAFAVVVAALVMMLALRDPRRRPAPPSDPVREAERAPRRKDHRPIGLEAIEARLRAQRETWN